MAEAPPRPGTQPSGSGSAGFASAVLGADVSLLSGSAVTWLRVLLVMVPVTAYYAALICLNYGDLDSDVHPTAPGLFTPVHYGLTFNSMLLHLLHGTFDVDPRTIGLEGSVHNGLTYAYFGIFPALLRLPFVAGRDFATTDYTRLSCLAAVSVMGAFNLASLLTLWRVVARRDGWPLLLVAALAVLFGGSQIGFLIASVWQEVTLWAAALASGFVYFVVRGYCAPRGFTKGLLAGLATMAGLCLLTRVSTALGLYIALGLLMLQLLWRDLRGSAEGWRWLMPMLGRFVPAALLLAAFIAITAAVNYGRWGNPLAFTSDYHSYLLATPERLARDAQYGQFSIVRIFYALAYYFVPVWVIRTGDGSLLWSAFQQRTIDSVELPPSSFFVSDPLLIVLTGIAIVQLVKGRIVKTQLLAPILIGLCVPVALILTYASMTFRYRLEFYPLIDMCALIGVGALWTSAKRPPMLPLTLACALGIVASHGLWVLYALGRYGNAVDKLAGMDVISFYASFFQ